MLIFDLLKNRSLQVQKHIVLVVSGLSVGLTSCYLYGGSNGELPPLKGLWECIACFFFGYVATGIVCVLAGASAAYILDEYETSRIIIVIGITLSVASLGLLFVSVYGGSGHFGEP